MVIAIIGIGGVGGYFGGKLAHILEKCSAEENEIYFVARGEHGRKIRENGLILKTNLEGEMLCRPTKVLENIVELPELDVCFLCVKQYDLYDCLISLKEKVRNDTKIIPVKRNYRIDSFGITSTHGKSAFYQFITKFIERIYHFVILKYFLLHLPNQ